MDTLSKLTDQELKEQHPFKLLVPTMDGYNLIDTQEIIVITSEDNYTRIKTTTTEIVVCKTMKTIQQLLPNTFFRIHNQTIINFEFVKNIFLRNEYKVQLMNGQEFPISQRRKGELEDFLKKRFVLIS